MSTTMCIAWFASAFVSCGSCVGCSDSSVAIMIDWQKAPKKQSKYSTTLHFFCLIDLLLMACTRLLLHPEDREKQLFAIITTCTPVKRFRWPRSRHRAKHYIAGLLPLHLGRRAAAAAVGGSGRRRLQSSSRAASAAAAGTLEAWAAAGGGVLLLLASTHLPPSTSAAASYCCCCCCCLSTSVQPKAHPQAVP